MKELDVNNCLMMIYENEKYKWLIKFLYLNVIKYILKIKNKKYEIIYTKNK